jgi:putative membrane protein
MSKRKLFYEMMGCLLMAGMLVSCGDGGNRGESTTEDTTANATKAEQSMGLDENAKEFMKESASGSMMEVQLADVAMQKTQNQEVRNLAQTIKTDHEQLNSQMEQLAQQKQVMLSDSLMDDHRKKVEDLQQKSANEFDKAYVDMMVKDHKDDIDKYEKMRDDTQDSDLQALINNSIPVLQKHHDQAKQLQESMNQ